MVVYIKGVVGWRQGKGVSGYLALAGKQSGGRSSFTAHVLLPKSYQLIG